MSNDSILTTVADCLSSVLKGHYTEKKRAEREGRRAELSATRRQNTSLRTVVFTVIPEAAKRASANFTLPFTARQHYYQVRPLAQQYTSKELTYSYFTPPLLTEYEDIFGSLKGLVYEPRGHFTEPHKEVIKCPKCKAIVMEADVNVPLGTLNVEEYKIPEYEYDKILYVEKQGFRQIFDAVKLGQRYDMAIMATQGFSTRAAKALLAPAPQKNITILAAHDCDIAGYDIARTLQNATRTAPGIHQVIDIGLSVEEALDMGLPVESVSYKKAPPYKLLRRLTSEEKDFLVTGYANGRYYGKRVELDAMTASQLVSWIEGKLKALGLEKKVLPPETVVNDTLKDTINSKLEDDAKQLVREAIEELLGATIADIERDTKVKIGEPESDGYYEELEEYLDGCPPEYWRNWISDKATELEKAHFEDKVSRARKLLSCRLRTFVSRENLRRSN